MQDFEGKRILVTGASGGIGQAIVAGFQARGATVTGCDMRDGAANYSLTGDLSDPTFRDALPQRAAEAMGGLDILVNNAGVITRGSITETSDADYARTMAINVEAPFKLCRAAIPLIVKEGGGAIVNVSSCWGVHPGPRHPLYVMSKAALASLTECLGIDHAHQNIRINAVCPNEVNTPMLRSGFAARGFDPDTAIEALSESVPIGRIAGPEEIANVVFFLASEQASYLCGSLIEAHGGKRS